MLSLRCALSQYLLHLSSDPQAPVLFRCTASTAIINGGSGDGGGGAALDVAAAGLMPTLFLVKDALVQVRACRVGVIICVCVLCVVWRWGVRTDGWVWGM